MSQFFQAFGAGDLALGKPPLYWLRTSATVRQCAELLSDVGLSEVSVWECSCDDDSSSGSSSNSSLSRCSCACLGAVNSLDISCFLASPDASFASPLSHLLASKSACTIRHVDLSTRLTKVLELAAGGVHYFVVPLPASMKRSSLPPSPWPRKEHCWISLEAVARFMMTCISAFCPWSLFPIDELGIIGSDFLFMFDHERASDGIHLFLKASECLTAVALVQRTEEDGDDNDEEPPAAEADPANRPRAHNHRLKLVGDVSPSSLRGCDESLAALALTAMTCGEFLSCVQDSRRNSRYFVRMIRARIMNSLSSVHEEGESSELSDSEQQQWSSRNGGSSSGGSRMLTCKPWSSLVAVMAQALAHRSNYVWVIAADNTLTGIVTYADMLGVLVKKLHSDKGRIASSQKLFSSAPKPILPKSQANVDEP